MIAALALILQAQAAGHGTVVTDTFWSQSLGARKQVVVYLPPSYDRDRGRRYPVSLYLHGLTGGERDWVDRGRLADAMDSLVAAGRPEFIVVMPDGDDSWYTTFNVLVDAAACRRAMPRWVRDSASYCVPWPHYDDYVARDVVQYVDRRYRTRAARAHRGIAGLSMGGYGAVELALEYPDVFAAAASHSGVLVPRDWAPAAFATPLPGPRDSAATASWRRTLSPSLRVAFGPDSAGWNARDPLHTLARLRAKGGAAPALYADCGAADPFLGENRAFRDGLRALGVALVYHEWPGSHSWAYWSAHVGESLAWLGEQIAR